jgi:cell division protein FtsZ
MMHNSFHDNANKREQTPMHKPGTARPKPDVYATQHDQWAVLRREVEVEDRMQKDQKKEDWEWDQRVTDDNVALFSPPADAEMQVDIVVVGVGGGGMNAVNRMIDTRVRGVRFMALNTDAQVLAMSEAPTRICLGQAYTKGLGAGGMAQVGARAAMESATEIREALGTADLVFIAAGMGGGTGTGGAPIIAQIARKMGALTVGIVTLPFAFEGSRRRRGAEEGMKTLSAEVDAIITVPNDRLLSIIGKDRTLSESFKVADDVLRQGVQGIAEVINVPGLINVDFADVRSVLKEAGTALMSIGQGQGRNRAQHAAEEAIAGGFLNVSIRGAQRVLFNISGGEDMTLFEVNEVAESIGAAIHDTADITFGAVIDPSLSDSIRVTLIAAGMPETNGAVERPVVQLHDSDTTTTHLRGGYHQERGIYNQEQQSANSTRNTPAPANNPPPMPHAVPANANPTPTPRVALYKANSMSGVARPSVSEPTTASELPAVRETEKAPRVYSRPQRSLDDLRGLRSMGRRRASEEPESAEVEVPPFLRRNK